LLGTDSHLNFVVLMMVWEQVFMAVTAILYPAAMGVLVLPRVLSMPTYLVNELQTAQIWEEVERKHLHLHRI
jgi:hypothetical protein